MTEFLLVGMLVGLIISLFHVAYLSRLVASGEKSATSGTGGFYTQFCLLDFRPVDTDGRIRPRFLANLCCFLRRL